MEILDELFEAPGRVCGAPVHGNIRECFGIAVAGAGALFGLAATGNARIVFELPEDFIRLQKQLGGGQNRAQAIVTAVFVTGPGFRIKGIDGIVQTVGGEYQGAARQIIKQRGGFIEKQREIVFDARRRYAVGNVLVHWRVFVGIGEIFEPAIAKA